MSSFPKEAMILAAGLGSRLSPITDNLPKPLLPIINKPIIFHNLDKLKTYGVQKVYINLFYGAEKIRQSVGQVYRGMQIHYSLEDTLLGTGGGIAKMLPCVGGDHFVCINADTLHDVDLMHGFVAHRDMKADATMVLVTADEAKRETKIGLAATSSEYPASGVIANLLTYSNARGQQHCLYGNFVGSHFFSTTFLHSYLGEMAGKCIIKDGYMKWLAAGRKIGGFIDDSELFDIGTIERALYANRLLLAKNEQQEIRGNLHNVTIVPPVLLGSNVSIDENCTIGPNVSVGDNVRIGKSCELKDCIVLSNVSVAEKTKLFSSILHNAS